MMVSFLKTGRGSSKQRIIFSTICAIMILATGVFIYRNILKDDSEGNEITIDSVLEMVSVREPTTYDHIRTDSSSRMNTLIALPYACWYDISEGSSNLFPLLVDDNEGTRRFGSYTGLSDPLHIGNEGGSEIARTVFKSSPGMILVSDDEDGYSIGLSAVLLASYLNIPVMIVDQRSLPSDIASLAEDLGTNYAVCVGNEATSLVRETDLDRIEIANTTEAFVNCAKVVEDRFSRLDYITLTNPLDTVDPPVIEVKNDEFRQDINSILIDTGTVDVDLIGESVMTHGIEVEDGIQHLLVQVNFTEIRGHPLDPLKDELNIEPMSFLTLRDTNGDLVASSPSFISENGDNFVESLVFDHPGTYELEVKVYYGIKGLSTMMGTSLGLSRIEGEYSVNTINARLDEPHLPLFKDHSMMAPYLSASRGGLVLSSDELSLFEKDDIPVLDGYSTGPWYRNDLLDFANGKAISNTGILSHHLDLIPKGISETYKNDKGWLAILGGGNMIPMGYETKDPSWEEDPVWGTGWATDIPYSLDLSLSVGRPLGRDVGDVSALIARTLFYENYTEGHIASMQNDYGSSGSWKDHFHFLAGEGGGRTGWLFHQRDFSATAQQHGFNSEVYMQDYENGREYLVSRGAFERANYFEMILHGDWSWFSPELNGWDRYSTGIRVSDVLTEPEDWELGPSVFNSGVCLLGRLGGLRPEQSITQAFFHSGINAFFCATRSTGSEAKAGPIEEALLFEDLSTGEAIRKDKRDNPEPPTYFVRTLYGDPAFDPYEPENGYGDQGRPAEVRRIGQ